MADAQEKAPLRYIAGIIVIYSTRVLASLLGLQGQMKAGVQGVKGWCLAQFSLKAKRLSPTTVARKSGTMRPLLGKPRCGSHHQHGRLKPPRHGMAAAFHSPSRRGALVSLSEVLKAEHGACPARKTRSATAAYYVPNVSMMA